MSVILKNLFALSLLSILHSLLYLLSNMSFMELALESINQRTTGPVPPFAEECPTTFTCPRSDFEVFTQTEQRRNLCTFWDQTETLSRRRNKVFLQRFGNHDGTPYQDSGNDAPGASDSQVVEATGTRRGRPSLVTFNKESTYNISAY
jgi:hypothetical protein